MESVLAPATSRPDPAMELIDLSFPEDPFRRMKACSVVTYGESRLQRLPWSGLHRRNERGPSSITVESPNEASLPGGRWAVTSRGVPLVGTYERSVFRALEWIAIDASLAQGHPLANPMIVHPRDICERLCWRATQPQFDAIEQSMQNLCRVEIEEGTAGMRFGLLRSAIAGTQRTVNRSLTCPQFVVYFDRSFIDSVNAGHVRPINWGLWIALREPIAQRMLEILDPEFRAGTVVPTLDADLLAQLVPLPPTATRNRRRILLEQAHASLKTRGYLKKIDRHSSGSSDLYTYHPGPTYVAMQYRLERQPGLPPQGRALREARG